MIQDEHLFSHDEIIHLRERLRSLSPEKKMLFSRQLQSIPFELLPFLRTLIHRSPHVSKRELSPFRAYQNAGDASLKKLGQEALCGGAVACLLVAGGQGTRLGFSGPKGCYPISPVYQKSLYQMIAERVAASSQKSGQHLSLAVMTSPQNHQESLDHFLNQRFFGLLERQVDFFSQSELPLLDEQGQLFLRAPGELATGPDGNGSSLFCFYRSGLWEKYWNAGVRTLTFVQVDNPLNDPLDPELIGLHLKQENSVTMKCIRRENPQEKVGVIVSVNGKPQVVEYSEISSEERLAQDEQGKLLHPLANISTFAFSMEFIRQLVLEKEQSLPYHKAHKAMPMLDSRGTVIPPGEPNCWKFERFIFDTLPFAEKVGALVYPRKDCFAPLKDSSGKNGPDGVKQALLERDRNLWSLTKKEPIPSQPFELEAEDLLQWDPL